MNEKHIRLMSQIDSTDQDFKYYRQRYVFENGYTASVICTPTSYGSDAGLFEVGWWPKDGDIEVSGHLDHEGVALELKRIKHL